MEFLNQLAFIGALLLFVSILASALASRFGAPLLLVFLVLGMLAGEEGLGGVRFDNFEVAYLVSTMALAVILFDGGMRTPMASFRVALWPALSLATFGVMITAMLIGAFSSWLLGFDWVHGLLLGAIIASTDAAAVFSLLHGRGVELKERVGATLEIESGINDPMAVFLTIVMIEIITSGENSFSWSLVPMFLTQMGLGAMFGILGGHMLIRIINRLPLATGMYPLLALAGGLMVYAITTVAGGSGYLAIYLAGLLLGNRPLHARQNILRVHDGMAWLAQIGMFVLLGLLATPSDLLESLFPSVAIALVLMLVARPLAVFLSLLPFSAPWREQVFISWVGLRGAVPIILAIFPLLAGLENAQVYFNVAFIVVVSSLVLQGWTMSSLARVLNLQVPATAKPMQRVELDIPVASGYELVTYQPNDANWLIGSPLSQLRLPDEARLVAVVRGNGLLMVDETVNLQSGDCLYLLTDHSALEQLNKLFATDAVPAGILEQQFYGEFVIDGKAFLNDIAMTYGLKIPADIGALTAADYLAICSRQKPVVGDRVKLDSIELVVRAIADGKITKVGISLHETG
ncbi:MAG: potassium/proton antiporter [Gammaproteobacteria bacterium]